jgi:hypothetical protein
MALFQRDYVNSHWKVRTNWNFKQRCLRARDLNAGRVSDQGDGDDQGDDGNDDVIGENSIQQPAARNVGIDEVTFTLSVGSSKLRTASDVKSGQRYTHAKKLFDEIAAHFSSNDLFTSFVDVLCTVIITHKSGDPEAGFARIRSYITVDARLQKAQQQQTALLPAVKIKEGRKTNASRGKMIREMRTSAP